MIPLGDENPTLHRPVAVYILIGMNLLIWGAVQGWGNADDLARSYCLYALVPGDLLNVVAPGTTFPVGREWLCQVTPAQPIESIFTSMFMHGGWFHLLGNLLFLWVFGDNVEDIMGTGRFFVFYVLCGVGAALAQIISDPGSTIPMVGASGAIGGVMGAYALSFPRARIHLWFIITVISVPAILVLGYWFAIQLFSGVSTIDQRGGGVAFWAHIGGFVSGLVLVFAFRQPALVEARRAFLQGQAPRRQPNHRWP